MGGLGHGGGVCEPKPVVGTGAGAPAEKEELALEAIGMDLCVGKVTEATERLEVLTDLFTRLASNPILVADEGTHAFEAAHEAVLRFLMPGRAADLGVGV